MRKLSDGSLLLATALRDVYDVLLQDHVRDCSRVCIANTQIGGMFCFFHSSGDRTSSERCWTINNESVVVRHVQAASTYSRRQIGWCMRVVSVTYDESMRIAPGVQRWVHIILPWKEMDSVHLGGFPVFGARHTIGRCSSVQTAPHPRRLGTAMVAGGMERTESRPLLNLRLFFRRNSGLLVEGCSTCVTLYSSLCG